MKSKAHRIAFPRKSRLVTLLSLAITLSLLTPLAPAAFGAGGAGSPFVGSPLAAVSAAAIAPAITATKSDAFPSHPSGKAEPGDIITYTVQINNSGTDATGVVFNDTIDPNTTLVGGSITTTPVAIDDSYSAVGNVRIGVPAASGLTANDSDPDGGTITVVAGSTTSAQGGEVTVDADGSFIYNPPAGFEGADTFTYTINGASAPSNTATVTVNVAGMIWFVDDSAGSGDGRLTSPFSALSDLAATGTDDNIFLYSGNYTGGLTLQSGQRLIGEGATDSLAAITGLTPPSYSDPLPTTGGANPVISGTSGITVAAFNLSNLIRGITVANTGGTAISGLNFIALTVEETTVSNTNGAGVSAIATGPNSLTLTISNNCTFENISGSAIIAQAGGTSTMNATVQDSKFQNAPVDGKNNVVASTSGTGQGTFNVLNNTFTDVMQTASTGEGVISIAGAGTVAGNTFAANVSGNIVSGVGNITTNCGGGGVRCLGSLNAIVVTVSNATSLPGTIIVDGNNVTNAQQGGVSMDIANTAAGSSAVAAKIINNVLGTVASRIGQGAGATIRSGIRVTNSRLGSNVLLSGNSVRNGDGLVGSALNAPGVFVRGSGSGNLSVTATGNDIETSSTGVAELRADVNAATATLCLDASGNTLDANNGSISLTRTGVLNVEQANAAALATANNIPAGNVAAAAGTTFGVACLPPVASFRPSVNANRDYLAAVGAPATNAAQNFFYLTGGLPNRTIELMSGLDAWRTNSKSLGGLSFNYAAKNIALSSGLTDTVVRPARKVSPAAPAYAPAAAPMFSGETINVNIGTLPAGKSMTITFQVTIDNTIAVTQVSNQGTVSGTNFGSVLTDDPDTGAFGDPTITPVFLGVPPDISCPTDISVGTDPGVSTASVSFNVTATGTPTPTIDCKIGATTITSPYTFPLGETTVMCTATNGVAPDDSCSFKVTVTDDEAPVIDCPDNITVSLPLNSNATGMAVNFTVTATDNADPTPTINTSVASGSVFPVGTTTVTATATDDAGNQSTCQFTVTVLYNFTGFFSPVSNPPTLNEVKAGQNIPLKFSLSGNKGLNIFAAGYPASQQINCSTNAQINVLEETETPGGSTLTYDASSDRYQYNWKSEKAWAGTCRVLVVKLADGTEHIAYFKFK